MARDFRALKACIFKVDRIGDFVLALGAIRRCTDFYGEVHCALVVHKLVADLARREFPKATIIELSRNTGAGLKDSLSTLLHEAAPFQQFKFDTLICLRHQRSLLHDVVLSWIHTERSVGLENSVLGTSKQDKAILPFPFTNVVGNPSSLVPNSCFELERHRAVLSKALGIDISITDVLPRFGSIQSAAGNHLLVTPFSSAKTKDYPESAMLDALKRFHGRHKIPIVFSGSPADQAGLERLQSTADQKGIASSVQIAKSVPEFVGIVAGARAVLTVDTASAHIATTLNKPTVVILGGGHFEHFGPWQRSDRQIWITNRLPCFGCDWKCIYNFPKCITEIAPITIAEALQQILA